MVLFWVLPYEINSALRWIDIVAVISILLFIVKLFWYFRASKNIHAFGAKKITSPIMAVIWWFVPVLFFWKPYQITQQLWKASDPQVPLTEDIEWKKIKNSKLINQWWVSQLVSITSAVFFAVFGGVGSNIELIEFMIISGVAFLISTFISTILFIQIIRQISTWQNEKSTTLV